MYFTFQCPKCNKKLKVKEEAAGRKAGCPFCKAAIVVPSPSSQTEEEGLDAFKGIGEKRPAESLKTGSKPDEKKTRVAKKTAGSGSGADRTDVSMITSGLFGLIGTAGFLLLMLPFYKFYLGELFLDRGWVPYVLVFLLSWSVSILVLKSQKLKRQKASMLFDLLPNEVSEDITEESLDRFVEHIHGLPVESAESFLVNRVLRGLEHFRVRKSNPEVASMLTSQSEIDANAVLSSYTILNVFIWAIPILGFIGTVIGISTAVGGFSGSLEQAQDISVLKESLNGVTGGLATAFDTTLIALVMSMLVMFPASSMQKAEEDLLNSIDEYCNENLLKRLNDGTAGMSGGSGGDPTTIRRAVDAAMAPHHAELKAWESRLKTIGSSLTSQVAEGWEEINGHLKERQQENVEHAKDLDGMAAAFMRTLANLAKQTEVVHQQAAGSMSQSAESLEEYCSALEDGLAGLNGVLAKLGEKQVVVNAPPRRFPFFGRNKRT